MVSHTVWHSLWWGGQGGVKFPSVVTFGNLKRLIFVIIKELRSKNKTLYKRNYSLKCN